MIDNKTSHSPLPATARADLTARVAEAAVLPGRQIFLPRISLCSHRRILPQNEH